MSVRLRGSSCGSMPYEPLERNSQWPLPQVLRRQRQIACILMSVVGLAAICAINSRSGHIGHSIASSPLTVRMDPVDGVHATHADDLTRMELNDLASTLSQLQDPPVRRAVDGVLSTTLRMVPVRFQEGPIAFWTRAYEGRVPAPTLSVHPGDTIRVSLVNELGSNVEGNWTINTYNRPNTTNLHVHGMHVDPTGISDNIFRTCSPGETMLVEIHVPMNHPRGLYMYHPHHHGSVMLQMGGGMVGAVVVEDDLSKLPKEYDHMARHLMVLQEFTFTGGMASNLLRAAEASRSQLNMKATYSAPHVELDFRVRRLFPQHHKAQKPAEIATEQRIRELVATYRQLPSGVFYTINGQFLPKISVRPTENHQLRLLNAGGINMFQLYIPGCSVHQVAADGVYFSQPRQVDPALVLSPGARADVVIQCTEEESLRPIVSVRHSEYSHALGKKAEVFEGILGFLEVQGEAVNDKIVSSCPQETPDLYAKDDLRRLAEKEEKAIKPFVFEFSMGSKHEKDGFQYKDYYINHQAFNPSVFIPVALGQVQEWIIVNRQDESGKTTYKNHPFHLHTNSFQVVHKSHGGDIDYQVGDWRDVITVPTPGNVTIRFRPVDYTGAIVAHCHILGHSDAGMIARVDIVDDRGGI